MSAKFSNMNLWVLDRAASDADIKASTLQPRLVGLSDGASNRLACCGGAGLAAGPAEQQLETLSLGVTMLGPIARVVYWCSLSSSSNARRLTLGRQAGSLRLPGIMQARARVHT
jgi:hypothetical protein